VKLYTRKGDDGKTNLLAGPRVAKDDPHVEACGSVDELNAQLGVVRAEPLPEDVDLLLRRIQHDLFGLGAELAMLDVAEQSMGLVSDAMVLQLERDIDTFDAMVPPLEQFILPGGVRSAALLHVARTVCRRAERRVVSLAGAQGIDVSQCAVFHYLNRLSDLLFVVPRVLNARADVRDDRWCKGGS
jgi:cob(I)alamin adenosyltransferase